MDFSDELTKFILANEQSYEEIESVKASDSRALYFHKRGLHNVMVRALRCKALTHGWYIARIEVNQYTRVLQSEVRVKKTRIIQFDGELIFTLIHQFCQELKRTIIQELDSHSEELIEWCNSQIDDVFTISSKTSERMGYCQGFIKVSNVMRIKRPIFYFQMRRWFADLNSKLNVISRQQNIKGLMSYGAMFDCLEHTYQQMKKHKQGDND